MRKNEVIQTALLILLIAVAYYGSWYGLTVALQTENPLMVVVSGSMIPTLNIGDIIVVRGIDPTKISVGQIIVFKDPTGGQEDFTFLFYHWREPRKIVHRVVEIQEHEGEIFFRTKGDNAKTNPAPDNWMVPSEFVVGAYQGKIPYLGHVVIWMREPIGATLVAIVALLLVLTELLDSTRKRRTRCEECIWVENRLADPF